MSEGKLQYFKMNLSSWTGHRLLDGHWTEGSLPHWPAPRNCSENIKILDPEKHFIIMRIEQFSVGKCLRDVYPHSIMIPKYLWRCSVALIYLLSLEIERVGLLSGITHEAPCFYPPWIRNPKSNEAIHWGVSVSPSCIGYVVLYVQGSGHLANPTLSLTRLCSHVFF